MKSRLARVLPLVLSLSLLTACSAPSQPQETQSDLEAVSIGVVCPAPMVQNDTYFFEGIELAEKRINEAGGVLGKPLQLLIRDDEGDSTTALQIAQTFVDMDVPAVIGHWGSNVCYVVEDTYEEHQVVMLSPAATSLSLFEFEYQYIFRMINNNQVYAQRIARHIAEQGLHNIAIFYSNDVYGSNFANVVERELTLQGINVVDRITNISQANAHRIEERWNAFGCDGVFVAAVLPGAADALRLIRGLKGDYPIFGAENFDRKSFVDEVGGDVRDVYNAVYDPDALDPSFMEAFQAAYGHMPDTFAITGYQAVYLLCDAMEAQQSTDSGQIAAFLRGLQDYPAVSGSLSYNADTREFEGQRLHVSGVQSH